VTFNISERPHNINYSVQSSTEWYRTFVTNDVIVLICGTLRQQFAPPTYT
jgi:hypothetical protein